MRRNKPGLKSRILGLSSVFLNFALILLFLSAAGYAEDGSTSGLSLLGRYLRGQPRDVVIAGTNAYVAHDTGIEVLSVAGANKPVPTGHVYLQSEALDMCVSGTTVYAACGVSGVEVVDVSNPGAPSEIKGIIAEPARAVAVQGSLLLVAEGSPQAGSTGGLRIYDISTPESPTPLGYLALDNGANAVSAAGSYAYVGLGCAAGNLDYGLMIVDIADPGAPILRGTYFTTEEVNDLFVRDETVFLAAGVGSFGMVYAVDVTSPASPAELDRLPLTLDAALDLSMDGDILLVAAGEFGLALIDAADPSSLSMLSVLPTDRKVCGVASLAGTTLIAERNYYTPVGALSKVDLQVPSQPRLLGSTYYSSAAGVAPGPGDVAYFLSMDALHVFNVQDPADAREIGNFKVSDAFFFSVEAAGDLVFIADGDAIRILDASDPTDPVELSTATLPSYAMMTVVRGAVLYAVHSHGYTAYDISSPDSPDELGGYHTDSMAVDMDVEGTTGYLAAGQDVIILDVTDPGRPVAIGDYFAGDFLQGIEVRDKVAYLIGLDNVILSVDLSDPGSPQPLDAVGEGPAFGLSIVQNTAVVSAWKSGIRVFDITDPAHLSEIAYYDTSGGALSATLKGAAICAATLDTQFWILDCPDCSRCPVPPETRQGLRFARQGASIVATWDPPADPNASRLYRVEDPTLAGRARGDLPEATLVAAGDAAPLEVPDEIVQGPDLAFYQLVGVCPDFSTEGPN